MNEMEELERELDRLEKDPANPQLLFAVGKRLYQLGELNGAVDFFRRAQEVSPQNFDIILQHALIWYHQREYDRARSVVEACLQPSLKLERLVSEQIVEQMIWQGLRSMGIHSLALLDILVLPSGDGALRRKLINWGANAERVKENEYDFSSVLSCIDYEFDLVFLKINSQEFIEIGLEAILAEIKKNMRKTGVIFYLQEGKLSRIPNHYQILFSIDAEEWMDRYPLPTWLELNSKSPNPFSLLCIR
jgi:tetratricopeptide (TPR) repeat protein